MIRTMLGVCVLAVYYCLWCVSLACLAARFTSFAMQTNGSLMSKYIFTIIVSILMICINSSGIIVIITGINLQSGCLAVRCRT